ncbi:hypothetical protein DTO164E3_5480 [Paecilomyces variotii]|nr:hypothetical protein DTO164E3_5480 [Paecilomyces variotii]KAJ9243233.1 hypothetical protein DTO169E5_2815 [Paecilomyces variotii]KAJ9250075.1 hypothetical protein DTO195F2_8279 [Paecilomyces variotii]KAJ9256801.1 hypothetical protein DTO207G8_2404 [Paecilomyces variotii]KAJ9314863.1 hypothetical protein DTO271D3_4863 [Paecilomyces variotii]
MSIDICAPVKLSSTIYGSRVVGCSNQCRRDQLIVLGHQKEKNKKPRRLSKAPRRFTLLLSAHRLSPGDPDFPKVYQSGSRFPIAYSRAESP